MMELRTISVGVETVKVSAVVYVSAVLYYQTVKSEMYCK